MSERVKMSIAVVVDDDWDTEEVARAVGSLPGIDVVNVEVIHEEDDE